MSLSRRRRDAEQMLAARSHVIACLAVMSLGCGSSGPPAQPTPDVSTWPIPLQELRKAITAGSSDPHSASMELLLLSGLPEPHGVGDAMVRIRPCSKATLDVVVSQLELRPTDQAPEFTASAERVRESAPPDWWAQKTTFAKYYVSQRWIDGGEADLYLAAYDESAEFIYLLYTYNF